MMSISNWWLSGRGWRGEDLLCLGNQTRLQFSLVLLFSPFYSLSSKVNKALLQQTETVFISFRFFFLVSFGQPALTQHQSETVVSPMAPFMTCPSNKNNKSNFLFLFKRFLPASSESQTRSVASGHRLAGKAVEWARLSRPIHLHVCQLHHQRAPPPHLHHGCRLKCFSKSAQSHYKPASTVIQAIRKGLINVRTSWQHIYEYSSWCFMRALIRLLPRHGARR